MEKRTSIIDDYIKDNGEWAKAKKINGKTHQTLSGKRWFGIEHRCNDLNYHKTHPNYSGVSNGFRSFQSFVHWHRSQIGYCRLDWHLDKDLLVKSNKVYCEECCILLPRELNSLIVWKSTKKNNLPVGVQQNGHKFVSSINLKSKTLYLGTFDNSTDAFYSYKFAKEDWIKQQANKWKDQIDPRAYEALINYQVEITD